MSEESQKLKRIAASAYDYDNDPQWVEYWSNILIPPSKACRSDVVEHFKHKFYKRFIDPELVVEPMPSASSQSAGSSASPSSSSTNGQSRPRNTGSSSGRSTQAGTNSGSLLLDRKKTIQFSVNAWVFTVALLSVIPILPQHLSIRAHRLSLVGTACSSVYSLYALYGKPRAWNLPALQVWLQSVISTKDFIYFLYCLTFVSSQMHSRIASIPVLCLALEHIAKFLRQNFSQSSLYRKYLDNVCVWVESNGTTLGILRSHAEIGLGFIFILSLFSWQRNIIQTFMYWQLLKLMYHAPVTAGYHQNVWAKISRTINPIISQYAPFLNGAISAIQRWWFR